MKDGAEGTVESQFAVAEEVQRWPAGSILFNEGDEPRGIFIIHSGQVELVFSARNGVRKALRTVRSGEILGLSEIVSGSRSDCTATTRTASRIGFITVTELRRMLDEDPSLWLEIAESLSIDLSSCWRSLRSLGASR
ncbi:MAG: Crp/Fnr family transcriptional regulator [Thermoanaerobaculia bacterium]